MASLQKEKAENRGLEDLSLPEVAQAVQSSRGLVERYSVRGAQEWLSDFIGESRVVGIGEPTHGNADCFAVQVSLTKQMIQQMQVRAVLVELPAASAVEVLKVAAQGAEAVREYIRSNPYPTWTNEAMIDLIMFVHEWNTNAARAAVKFHGLDFQSSRSGTVLAAMTVVHPDVRKWADEVASFNPESARSLSGGARLGDGWEMALTTRLNRRARGGVEAEPGSREDLIERGERLKYLVNRGSIENDLLQNTLHWLHLAYEEGLWRDPDKVRASMQLRDRLMASNVLRHVSSLKQGERAVVLAHNGHVAYGTAGEFTQGMGTAIKNALGLSYKVLLSTVDGGFVSSQRTRWAPAEVCPLTTPPRNSYESHLRGLSLEPFLYRVDRAKDDSVHAHIVHDRLPLRCMGWMYSQQQFAPLRLAQECDGLVFIPQARAGRLDEPQEN